MAKNEIAVALTAASPPAGVVVGVKVFGLGLPDWAAVVGMVVLAIQGAYYLWLWRQKAKAKP